MHLIDLALDPRVFTREIYFIAELFAHERICAQCVERGGYDGGFLLLVIEESAGRDYHGDNEEREGFEDLRGYEGWDAVNSVSLMSHM